MVVFPGSVAAEDQGAGRREGRAALKPPRSDRAGARSFTWFRGLATEGLLAVLWGTRWTEFSVSPVCSGSFTVSLSLLCFSFLSGSVWGEKLHNEGK